MYKNLKLETTVMSINRLMDKQILFYNRILLNNKRDRLSIFARIGMNLRIIMLSERSQTKK